MTKTTHRSLPTQNRTDTIISASARKSITQVGLELQLARLREADKKAAEALSRLVSDCAKD